MAAWTSYTPADFLLFSPRVYYRLLELHNAALWPMQIAGLALACSVLWLMWRGGRVPSRLIGIVLGALWIWVAWSFLWERYATINWAAMYIAPLFAAQGLLLIVFGWAGDRLAPVRASPWVRGSGIALLAATGLFYPFVAWAAGRPWSGAEVFGVFPDPTAAATLAVLAAAGRGAGWLMIVPALWCVLSSETLWLLGAADFFVPGAAALCAIFIRLAARVGSRSPRGSLQG